MLELLRQHAFYEMAAILVLTAVVGTLGFALRQPLIVAFLAVGVLVGPTGLQLIESYERIELLADIGIALLLFIVGLRLDLHLIRTIGPVALASGLGQVLFTASIGFGIVLALGYSPIAAAFIAVALTFSSTIIVVKLLSDKREIDSLHGRISIGFLIVQDIVAIAAMVALIAVAGGGEESTTVGRHALTILARGAGFLAVIAICMRWILPWLLERLARYQELLVLFAIAWAIALGAIGDMLGFSKEVGAFLGGVALASTHYREAIGARLVALRDFLLLFFFIALGARLEFGTIQSQIPAAILLSGFVLVGNPLIVLAIMGYMGYRRRTGFLAGLTVAQISEFSLILAALGVKLGHIDADAMSLVTVVGVVTICASTYMILYSSSLYRWLAPWLAIFERKVPYREIDPDAARRSDVDTILIGLGNYGSGLAEQLVERGTAVIGVDFDPTVLESWRARGLAVAYGDAEDPEFLDQLPLDRAAWIVSTTRDRALNLGLLKLLRARGFGGRIALAARDESDAATFAAAGADVVLRPFRDAAEQAADALTVAMHLLPIEIDWPLALRETRLRPGSVYAGKALRQLQIAAQTGVSILAISRAGKVHLDLSPDFVIYPGDRMVLMGALDNIRQAQALLEHRELTAANSQELPQFQVGELEAAAHLVGKSLAESRLREDHGVTVIGIRRGAERLTAPTAHETLRAGDRLVVVGRREAISALLCATS